MPAVDDEEQLREGDLHEPPDQHEPPSDGRAYRVQHLQVWHDDGGESQRTLTLTPILAFTLPSHYDPVPPAISL